MLNFRSLNSEIQTKRRGRPLLLLLDYDGTLVEIAPHPELARPTPEILEMLIRLTVHKNLRVMLVSGRPLQALQQLLPIPGLDFLGSHGGEAFIGGRLHHLPVTTRDDQALFRWRNLLALRFRPFQGWWIEDKPQGFTLHYRQVPAEHVGEYMEILQIFQEQVRQEGRWQVLAGKKVLEILPRGISKGKAIQAILVLPEFSGFFPIYLGDDITDESAFLAVRDQGLSIQVGDSRPGTAATHYLPDPPAVRHFLTMLTFPPDDPGCRCRALPSDLQGG